MLFYIMKMKPILGPLYELFTKPSHPHTCFHVKSNWFLSFGFGLPEIREEHFFEMLMKSALHIAFCCICANRLISQSGIFTIS